MKKQSLFKAINILLLSSLTTLTPFKSALAALDFNFSFGSTTGTITGLVDDDTTSMTPPLTVTVNSTGVPGAPIGPYIYDTGNAFELSAGNITGNFPFAPSDFWEGTSGAISLRFNITGLNTGLATINGSPNAFVTFTPINPPSVIPFEFSTTPGLIVLGGIFGISHLLRKVKNKQEQEKENKKEDRQDIKKDYQ